MNSVTLCCLFFNTCLPQNLHFAVSFFYFLNLSFIIISIQAVQLVYVCLFFSGSSSTECLPETKEAGGSHPGVGGTLARVFSVYGESFGF